MIKSDEHVVQIAMLDAEEGAFARVAKAADRAIMLRKEYAAMSETTAITIPVSDVGVMSAIMAAARDPSIDGIKLKEILETAERMMKFQAERDFSNEMRACQNAIEPIAKTAENSHTGTMYAKLETIDCAIRPVYTAHGFCMSFGSAVARQEDSVKVTCDVRHSGGHTVQYELEGKLDVTGAKGTSNKTPIHGLGSTVQHLRRYLTMMIWNITLTDRPQFVTREQAAAIWQLLDSKEITGNPERRRQFLKFAGAETVETIGSLRYNHVIAMLNRAQVHKPNGAMTT